MRCFGCSCCFRVKVGRSLATGRQIPSRWQARRTFCSAIFMAVGLPPPGWLAAPTMARDASLSPMSPDCSPSAMVWRLSATISFGAALSARWTDTQIARADAEGGGVDGGTAIGLDEQLATPTAKEASRTTPSGTRTDSRTRTGTFCHRRDEMARGVSGQ